MVRNSYCWQLSGMALFSDKDIALVEGRRKRGKGEAEKGKGQGKKGAMEAIGKMAGLVGAIALTTLCISEARAQVDSEAGVAPSPAEQLFEQLLEVPSVYDLGFRNNQDALNLDVSWPIVTQADTSLFDPTSPSLWWSRDQLYDPWGGYRLIRGWIAFRSDAADAAIIDIQLDPQYWNRLEYLQQYSLLNQLGITAMGYGYQLRMYSSISLVGMYSCDFSSMPRLEDSPDLYVPVPEIEDVECFAAVAPFVQLEMPFDEDLFAPP